MESIGGQAVIEGVMLRSKSKYVVAVRDSSGKIHSQVRKITDYRIGFFSILHLPFFRGIYAMYEMLGIGLKSLVYSSNISSGEDEKLSINEIMFTILLSLVLVIVLFIIAPYLLTTFIGISEQKNPILFNLLDSAIKLSFFVLYVYSISKMKDVKRVFQYHGAEHMSVHCYEHKLPLTIRNVKRFSPIHVRCGSSFVMHVVVLSIIVFSALPFVVYQIPSFVLLTSFQQKMILLIARILLLPVVIGLSYELLKLAGRYSSNIIIRLVSWPGEKLQELTTAMPDSKQIEVAIAAIKALRLKGVRFS